MLARSECDTPVKTYLGIYQLMGFGEKRGVRVDSCDGNFV